MPESNTYLKEAVNRLVQGLKTIIDSDGTTIITDAQAFIEPYPTGTNWATVHPFGLVRQEEVQGRPLVLQTWNIPIRVGIGNLGMEEGGIQQEKLWEWIPLVTNWITEHPTLQFAAVADEDDLTYLDNTVGVKALPGAMQARIEDKVATKLVRFEIIVAIPFRVPIKKIQYQDGELIEIE